MSHKQTLLFVYSESQYVLENFILNLQSPTVHTLSEHVRLLQFYVRDLIYNTVVKKKCEESTILRSVHMIPLLFFWSGLMQKYKM